MSHITVDYLISQGCEPEKAEHVFNSLTTRPQKRNIWWQALRNYSAIEEFCRANPGSVLYGEIYGDVNCIKYGLGGNVFSAFDILKDGKFLNPFDFYQHAVIHGLPIAPLVNTKIVRVEETGGSGVQVTVPYDFDAISPWPRARPWSSTPRRGPFAKASSWHRSRSELTHTSAA